MIRPETNTINVLLLSTSFIEETYPSRFLRKSYARKLMVRKVAALILNS